MPIQVSLTFELDASASMASLEEQIQAGGHHWMREADPRKPYESSRKSITSVRTVGAIKSVWRER
jgi:hypothetical protein